MKNETRKAKEVTEAERTISDVVIDALERRCETLNQMIAALQKERLWVLAKTVEMKRKAEKP